MKDKEEETKYENSKTKQASIEQLIQNIFDKFNYKTINSSDIKEELIINTDNHIHFINKMIGSLPGGYLALDSGMPWFAYWTLNAFDLFGMKKYDLGNDMKLQYISYLKNYLSFNNEGFSGYSSNALPHIISNYAAILAIVCLDSPDAYKIVDKKAIKRFLLSMKSGNNTYDKDRNGNFLISKNENKISESKVNHPGGFQVHKNGESDLRATYCALVVAYILDILDDELIEGVAENIASCQTFEGGLGPEQYSEAHGGYNFCGIGSLIILNKLDKINIEKQIKWLTHKQMSIEGGFQGRTNKLVDSCYSFWQGSVFNMLLEFDKKYSYESEMLYDQYALQAYIILACQQQYGIVDKPGKKQDLFHLNYAGVGLSLSQKSIMQEEGNNFVKICLSYHESLELTEMDPIFCVPKEKLSRAIKYFKEN